MRNNFPPIHHFERTYMTIIELPNHQRLRLINDSCGESIIQGRLGKDANISEFSLRNPDETESAMCWLTDHRRTGLWNATKKKCLVAGVRLHQDGDAEGIFVFDPSNPIQAKLAIKSVQAKSKRKMTPGSLVRLANVGFNGRKCTEEGLVFELGLRTGLRSGAPPST
jgi:hypothetical protein